MKFDYWPCKVCIIHHRVAFHLACQKWKVHRGRRDIICKLGKEIRRSSIGYRVASTPSKEKNRSGGKWPMSFCLARICI